jgi:nucleotide-binding universal stress UspA family protein
MLRSLMVPLDGSGFSEYSLPLAGKVARLTGASLHLAHVHAPYEPDQLLFTTPFQFEHVSMAEYDMRHRDDEERYMSGLADRLSGEGASVDAKILDGEEVVDELMDYADTVESDMIVMTSHGRSGLSRTWLGSVADALVRRTNRPIIVMHPKAALTVPDLGRSIRRILVALDGSALAESVLGPASDLARATGARLTLAQVVARPQSFGEASAAAGAGFVDPDYAEAVRYLEATAVPLRHTGLEVATHVRAGLAPAPMLTQMADQLLADLVAIATHGRGGVKRTLLGSVADQLLRSTSVPILVMRPSPAVQ